MFVFRTDPGMTGRWSRREVLGVLGVLGVAGVAGVAGLALTGCTAPALPPVTPVPTTLRSVWTGRPDGSLPPMGGEGCALQPILSASREMPSIRAGALVGNLPDEHAAEYLNRNLGGAVALVAWVPTAALTASCDRAVATDRWIASVANGVSLVTVEGAASQGGLPQDGRPLVV